MKIKLTFVLSSIFFLFGLFFLSQQTVKAFEFSNPTEIVENIGIVPHGPYLYYPADMVKDNAGNIYISESGNNRVLKYDIGTSNWVAMGSEGAGVGQFNWPEKIEVDSEGNVYVADYNNDRIQKYNIGTTSWSVFLDSGTNVGHVVSPYSIHFDLQGNIYVADQPSWNNNRIQKYNIGTSSWVLLSNTSGSGAGRFMAPRDITSDNIGNIYVADSDNNRIQKYEIGTTTWTILGSGGTGVGQFDWPTGVDIDSNGDLYVADGDNDRLQKYNMETSSWEVLTDYVALFGPNSPNIESYPYGIYIDQNDDIWVADIWNDRLQIYNASTDSWSTLGTYGNQVGQFGFPEKIEKDTLGNFYVTDSDNDRIQKYDIGTTSWSIFLDSGTAVGQVNGLKDIRIDTLGNIYVADSLWWSNYRIQKFDIETTTWSVFAIGGTGLGQVGTIYTLGVDKIGNIYVGDSYYDSSWNSIHRLQKYDIGTSQWSIVATDGTGIGQVKVVYDIEFDSVGNMYLADYTNKRIQKYDVGTSSWSVFGTGSTGTSPGDFLYPYGILIDNLDNVYVTEIDWFGSRNSIQKYDVGSSSWYKTGTSGFNPGEFSIPTDIEVDEYSNLYIVDSNNHRIQKFWYYHLANYSSSSNGSVVGLTSQKLSVGQSGTQVVAVGNSGYAFLEWSDGSIVNPRTDVGGTDALSVSASFTNTRTVTDVGASAMQLEIERNFISLGSTNPVATPNFTFNINYTFLAGSASIVFPAQTVVTPVGTSTIDLTQFRTIDNTIDIQTSLDRTLKSIQIGIPNFNLSFSSPVTVTIPVGTNYNNQTLSVVYRRESNTNWNDETSCLIIDGNCTFQTTHATTFTVLENQTQSSNNNNNSSSNIYIPDHSCHSSKPQFISDLFQIDTTKNTAKIFFTPQRDTNDYFVSFSSINSNAEEHGERVTLLREGVQSHTIYSLKPNTTYYVKVRGQNGCMPGDWSNIMQFKTNSKIYYRSSPITKSNLSTENKSNITTKLPIKTTNVSPPTLPPIESPSSVNSQPTKQVVSTPTPIPKKKCFLWWCW